MYAIHTGMILALSLTVVGTVVQLTAEVWSKVEPLLKLLGNG
jgi:hypothetical protein